MNLKLPVVTSKQLLRALQRGGFIIHRQKGSYIVLKNIAPPIRVVLIPYHNMDIKKGTLKAILRQARIDVEEFLKLL